MTTEELKTQMLQLPDDVRADLAYLLLQSLPIADESALDETLRDTLLRREREIIDGTATAIPADEVFARLKAKYT